MKSIEVGEDLTITPDYELNIQIIRYIASTHGITIDDTEMNELAHSIAIQCQKNKTSFASIFINRKKLAGLVENWRSKA